MSTIAPSIRIPSLRTSRRARRAVAAALVVAAVFVPTTSAVAVVAPRAMHAVEGFAHDLGEPHRPPTGR